MFNSIKKTIAKEVVGIVKKQFSGKDNTGTGSGQTTAVNSAGHSPAPTHQPGYPTGQYNTAPQNGPYNAPAPYSNVPPGAPYNAPPATGYQQPPMQQQMTPSGPGKRRALLIGINYFGQQGQLNGCINDVRSMHNFLTRFHPQYLPQNGGEILILTDEQGQQPHLIPTKQNILQAMQWLVANAQPGDTFFLHYSGHGSTVKDTDGDEADGMDSTICPLDFKQAGQITDDEMFMILCQRLPQGAKLTAIFDACHSGSVLDLPYSYRVDGNLEVIEIDNKKVAMGHAMTGAMSYITGNKKGAMKELMNAGKALMSKGPNQQAIEKQKQVRTTQALVVQFSGCRDDQTSADAMISGQHSGAMTWGFNKVFEQSNGQPITYLNLLKNMRSHLQGKYTQVPQMSTGYHMDMNQPFVI